MNNRGSAIVLALLAASLLPAGGCSKKASSPAPVRQVVVYTSLDQQFSEPLLKEFERRTGIKVSPKYDSEAAKTTGLVERLLACRDNPDCDVLWNNEIVQTHRLAMKGLLAAYDSPNAARIPPQFRDRENRWTGFAARARVLIYNTNLVSQDRAPKGLADLVDPQWKTQAAIAKPLFGTTLTHFAVLYEGWGPQRLGTFLDSVRDNKVALCAGNAAVKQMVASGECAFGLTDTDDAREAMSEGKNIACVFPDEEQGLMLIPNTVSLIARCPHEQEGKMLIDFLLSREVEEKLAAGPGAQIPLGTDLVEMATPWGKRIDLKTRVFDVQAVAESFDRVVELLRQKQMDR